MEAGLMTRVTLELDRQLYLTLFEAAQANRVSLEEDCCRRLAGRAWRSRSLQALVAELRADDQQRRASSGCLLLGLDRFRAVRLLTTLSRVGAVALHLGDTVAHSRPLGHPRTEALR